MGATLIVDDPKLLPPLNDASDIADDKDYFSFSPEAEFTSLLHVHIPCNRH